MNTNDPDLTPPPREPNLSEIHPSPPMNESDLVQREDIMARAEDRRNVCRILSRAHVLVSIRWSNAHLYIGIPSTVFAALASVQAISDFQNAEDPTTGILHIIFSLLVAGLAPLLTFLNPMERAGAHQAASRVYEQIADRYDAFLLESLVHPENLTQELNQLVQLNQIYTEDKKPLPLTPEWAFRRAKKEQIVAPLAREHKSRS